MSAILKLINMTNDFNKIVIFISSIDSDDITFMLVQASLYKYEMFMSQLNTPETLFFERKNITKFLNKYDDLCENYQIKILEKIRRLSRYCDMLIEQIIEILKDFIERRGSQLVKTLKKKYKSEDIVQQANSRAFLEAYKTKIKIDHDDIRNYCRKFAFIFLYLVNTRKLNLYTRVQGFMQKLSNKLCEKLFFRKDLNFESNDVQNFDELIKKILKYLNIKRKFTKIMRINKHIKNKYSTLINQFDKKMIFDDYENITIALQFSIASIIIFFLSKNFNKTIANLITKFEVMIMNMKKTTSYESIQSHFAQNSLIINVVQNFSQNYVKVNNLCNFCEMTNRSSPDGHDRRDQDSMFNKLINSEEIHLNDKNLICLRSQKRFFSLIRLLKKFTQQEMMRKTLLLNEKTLFTIEVHSMRIAKASENDMSSKNEGNSDIVIYDYSDETVAKEKTQSVSMNATRSDVKSQAKMLKKSMKKILKRKIKTKNKFDVPKTSKYDKGNVISQSTTQVISFSSSSQANYPKQNLFTNEQKVASRFAQIETFMHSGLVKNDVVMQETKPDKVIKIKLKRIIIQKLIKKQVQQVIKQMNHDEFLKIIKTKFNLNMIQARFFQSTISNNENMINENLITTLFMFRNVIKKIMKKNENSKKMSSIKVSFITHA